VWVIIAVFYAAGNAIGAGASWAVSSRVRISAMECSEK
jgi:hypothetical protein